MPVKRRRSKSRSADISAAQCIALIIGELRDRPEFRSEQERRAAWDAHRDEIMAENRAGSRPWAWWEYDAPSPRDESVPEADQLIALGVVDDAELAEIKSARAARPHSN